ncbi:hypothetical protein BC941DRAFT_329420, partial [Chlamydoabsidia padenii]
SITFHIMSQASHNKKVFRFVGDPTPFSGGENEDPRSWFRIMNRIRVGAGLSDEDTLLMVGSYLRGAAEGWFAIHEDKLTKWLDFKIVFDMKYCNLLDDGVHWEAILRVKQSPACSVEEVAGKLKNLFALVQISNTSLMVRTFLNATDPNISLLVEREGLSNSYDGVTSRAVTIEKVHSRYGFIPGGS